MSIFEGIEWGSVGQWVGATATFLASFIALRTSNNAYKAFMLDKRPYFAFDKIKFIPINIIRNGSTLGIEQLNGYIYFKNIGKSIAYYEVKNLIVNIYGDSEAEQRNQIAIQDKYNLSGRILPRSENLIRYSSVSGSFPQEVEGDIEFTIIYYRDEKEEKYEWTMKMKFTTNIIGKEICLDIINDDEKTVPPTGINRLRMILGL